MSDEYIPNVPKGWKATESKPINVKLYALTGLCLISINTLLYLFLCWCVTPYDLTTYPRYILSFSPIDHPYVVIGQIALNTFIASAFCIMAFIEKQERERESASKGINA